MSEAEVDVDLQSAAASEEGVLALCSGRTPEEIAVDKALRGRMDYWARKTLTDEQVALYTKLKGSQQKKLLLQLFTECDENLPQAMQLYVERYRVRLLTASPFAAFALICVWPGATCNQQPPSWANSMLRMSPSS